MRYNLITILGPTAVGKTRLAALIAKRFNGEIISADSRQAYKGMDIGTGKDLIDYLVGSETIPYHLIDIIEPSQEYNLFLFNELFYRAFNDIVRRGKIPILAGGTGLYLHSIIKGYELNKVEFENARYEELNELNIEELQTHLINLNPKLHNTTDLLIKDRVISAIIISEKQDHEEIKNKHQIDSLVIGVRLDRARIKTRITERLKQRIDNGMIEEVKKLVARGIGFDKLDLFGLEYRFVGLYLKGEINYNNMLQQLNTAIHQFAKRQMTWFRKMEREGINIHWIEGPNFEAAEQIILHNYFSAK